MILGLTLFGLGCQHVYLIPAQSGTPPGIAREPSSPSVSRTVIPVVDPKDKINLEVWHYPTRYPGPQQDQTSSVFARHNQTFFFSTVLTAKDSSGKDLSKLFTIESGEIQKDEFREFKNFKLTINTAQMKNLIAEFGNSTTLSGDPANYQIQLAGLLNEMNFHYKRTSSDCVPDYDPQTSAQVGMSFQNFSVSIIEENSNPGK